MRPKLKKSPQDVPRQALKVWREDGQTLFKVAEIALPVTGDNTALEAAARKRARNIEAQITYAYCLDEPASSAWWQDWGGYDLEPEIAYASVLARKDVAERLQAFDPADKKHGCANIDEYRDLLFVEYANKLSTADVERGFKAWVAEMPADARDCFRKDLAIWLSEPPCRPARKPGARPRRSRR